MVDSRLINAKFVNCNDRAPPPSRLPDVTHLTFSQAFPLRFYTRSDQKLEAGAAWERGYEWLGLSVTVRVRVRARAREWNPFLFFFFVNVVDIICCVLLACIVDVTRHMTSSGMKRGGSPGRGGKSVSNSSA